MLRLVAHSKHFPNKPIIGKCIVLCCLCKRNVTRSIFFQHLVFYLFSCLKLIRTVWLYMSIKGGSKKCQNISQYNNIAKGVACRQLLVKMKYVCDGACFANAVFNVFRAFIKLKVTSITKNKSSVTLPSFSAHCTRSTMILRLLYILMHSQIMKYKV